jgi:hypothetical protein
MSTQTTSPVVNARNASEAIAKRWSEWKFSEVSSLLDRDDPRPQSQEEATNMIVAIFASLQTITGLKNGVAILVGAESVLADCNELIDNVKYHASTLSKSTAYTLPSTFDGAFAGISFGSVIAKLFLKAGANDRRKACAYAGELIVQARA